MAGNCALYCSANFIVVTRFRAAVMVSGEGVCAGETEIGNRKRHAMIKSRLAMVSSDAPSCDGHLKKGFPRKALTLEDASFTPSGTGKLPAGTPFVQTGAHQSEGHAAHSSALGRQRARLAARAFSSEACPRT